MTVTPQRGQRGTRMIAVTLVITAVVIVVAVGVGVAVLSHHATSSGPEHPSAPAVALAKKYLRAIADGDAATARSIDKDADGASTPQIDNTTFTTGSALANATERIQHLSFRLGGDVRNTAWVNATYTLAGKTYKTQLLFDWDDAKKGWALKTDVATLVSVTGYVKDPATASYPLPYSLGGVDAAKLASGDHGLYFTSLVYPAVYPLVVDVASSKLVDAATPTTTTLLVPPDPYKGGTAKFELKAK